LPSVKFKDLGQSYDQYFLGFTPGEFKAQNLTYKISSKEYVDDENIKLTLIGSESNDSGFILNLHVKDSKATITEADVDDKLTHDPLANYVLELIAHHNNERAKFAAEKEMIVDGAAASITTIFQSIIAAGTKAQTLADGTTTITSGYGSLTTELALDTAGTKTLAAALNPPIPAKATPDKDLKTVTKKTITDYYTLKFSKMDYYAIK
jgi:flagellar hook-associated protein FlgK